MDLYLRKRTQLSKQRLDYEQVALALGFAVPRLDKSFLHLVAFSHLSRSMECFLPGRVRRPTLRLGPWWYTQLCDAIVSVYSSAADADEFGNCR
jgi:hypothetical protein